jgi:hypothetical protein
MPEELSTGLAQKTANLRKSIGFKEIKSDIKENANNTNITKSSPSNLDLDDDELYSLLEEKETNIEKKPNQSSNKFLNNKIKKAATKKVKTLSKTEDVFLEP